MGRVIKFRAWAVASRKMFYPDHLCGWEIKDGKLLELPNTILMQFTGLYDKNRTDIYEGDLLKSSDHRNVEVIFAQGSFMGKAYNENIQLNYFVELDIGEFEIIGNIYENPPSDKKGDV